MIALTLGLATILWLFAWLGRRRHRRLLATVTKVTIDAIASTHLHDPRPAYVFLPPGYDESGADRYPTLFLNDGQDCGALGLQETLANLYVRRRLRPIIVVAIPTNEARLQEYGTAGVPNTQGLGSRAGAYTKFVLDDLMPAIAGQFRPSLDPRQTAWLGASLGGLAAFDIAWQHPERFGIVGVLSGSFWWRAGAGETGVTANALIAPERVRQRGYRPGFRAWLEAGTRDETGDRDNDGVIDAIADTLEVLSALEDVGYTRGPDLVFRLVEDGRHEYETWRRLLPEFLTWAFGTGSAASTGVTTSSRGTPGPVGR